MWPLAGPEPNGLACGLMASRRWPSAGCECPQQLPPSEKANCEQGFLDTPLSLGAHQRPGSHGGTLGEHQAQPHTLTCPVGTELGDQINPRMGNSGTPQRGDNEGTLRAQLLMGGSVYGTCLVQ